MKHRSMNLLLLVVFCCPLYMAAGCDSSSNSDGGDTELLSVVAISRHGIRSATVSTESLNQYTTQLQGFPLWPPSATDPDVPGNLTIHGEQNVTRLGSWYRDFYVTQGFLPPRGSCPADGAVFVYADINERTIHTAQGYLDGMFPEPTTNCGIQVSHASNLHAADPYIVTAAAGTCKIDTAADLIAFNTRTGGAAALINTYSSQLQMLESVTKYPLLDLPTTVTSDGAVAFASGTLFNVADMITETFELEYAQGMPDSNCASTVGAQCFAWGAIPTGGLNDLMKLHVLNMGTACGLPSFAQVGSSNLMWQMVGTMDQTLSGVRNPDMLAPVTSKFTLFVAHDENLLAIASFLEGVSWEAEGFQRNDPGPAGALVFELHKDKHSGQFIVRLFYVIATLDQMRNATTLTLDTPPQRVPLAMPACGGAYDCPYDQFKSFITANVRQDCLVNQ